MSADSDALSLFHPVVRRWFARRYSEPTDIQARAWPAIGRGENVLITAPTGSGKTLTAFLSCLDRLLSGEWDSGATLVLYVSPLKALNNDIQRNLLAPLAELGDAFTAEGIRCPEIRVLTRSGDTPQHERQRMVRKPPEILITTPESLNLILTSVRARRILAGVKCVILDEIHAVAGGKRGTHLITAVERLTLLAGEFQRIAISATVKPMQRVADMVAGFHHRGGDAYEARPISIIESPTNKELALSARFVGPEVGEEEEGIWTALTKELREIIDEHSATLFFVNTRRHAEKISLFLNEGLDSEIAYAHHGSLAKEIRRLVEQKLMDGDLKAIVATSSLELGIDIGDLDLVVMVGSPNSVASGLQRIGRAGHRVGEVSRGLIYPLHGRDIVDAAVLTRAILERDIEETHPVSAPLDVLAQVLLAMTAVDVWDIDELFSFVRTAYPYRKLTRRQYDLVLQMLAGRYADSRIRELKARVYVDRFENTVKAADGVLNLIYLSGGTIPDRGYYGLKRSGAEGTIGELDEEFVWERSIGDTFTLGAQTWTITEIGDRDVEVQPASNPINVIPFWRAEAINRDFHYCDRILRALAEWNEVMNEEHSPYPTLTNRLRESYGVDERAAGALVEFLAKQRDATGRDVPHRRHLLIERYSDPLNPPGPGERGAAANIIVHTLWGGRVNRPLALIIEAVWEEEYGYAIQTFADNDSILMLLPNEADEDLVEGILKDPRLAGESRIRELLRRKLEGSGLFGGRFRENAGRALLLPRAGFKQRMPLWLTRLRSKKLLAAVSRYHDFPILAETWRTCLNDGFDLPRLTDLLTEIQHGWIQVSWARTKVPSPFTRGLIWKKTNTYMYQGDEPPASGPSRMGRDVLEEVLHSSRLRPRIPRHLVVDFESKVRRTRPGYAPTSADDLVQFVSDRVVVPADEWGLLTAAIGRDSVGDIGSEPGAETDSGNEGASAVLAEAGSRLVRLRLPAGHQEVVCSADAAAAIWRAAMVRPGGTDGADSAGDETRDRAAEPLLLEAAQSIVPGDTAELRDRLRAAVGAPAQTGATEPTQEPADASAAAPTVGDLMLAYLAHSGPVAPARLGEIFGPVVSAALSSLEEEGRVIADTLLEHDNELLVCDVENLETLLRMTRTAARPEFHPLPNAQLQLFLADYHGLLQPGRDPDRLDAALEQLFGFPLPVEMWEADIFPARLGVYYKSWLDSVLTQSELIWVGCGPKTATFLVAEERRIFLGERDASALFPRERGSYSFWELKDQTGLSAGELTERLWAAAWEGRCTTDGFEPVRRGIATGFEAEAFARGAGTGVRSRHAVRGAGPADTAVGDTPVGGAAGARRSRRRPSFRSWKTSRPIVGRWIALPADADPEDLLSREEDNKDRARQLLDRYGVLFRELLFHELPTISWAGLFRTLRIMELSGEIVAGQFFEGIRSLQFVRPDLIERLRRGFSNDAVYWMNACDPVSLCGRGVSAANLPPRIPSNYLVFRGAELVITARRRGRDLTIVAAVEDPRMNEYLSFLRVLASRDFDPLDRVVVESVNDLPTRESPFADALVAFGFMRDYKAFHLRPSF